ncbi:hypothetical protein HYFRA_00002523 [Hymenoscyphus fraxineus]|uniref:Epoxide hydrolase N-terminal domain-containing protein n=1 Tax=Hymenoscyphus fraxineus TaxID=746836 RepID=A0A9N9L8E0_9HELO|nr:hypothetical protein HYFRA_00002523 [Hymenoscyphus fraxineus]
MVSSTVSVDSFDTQNSEIRARESEHLANMFGGYGILPLVALNTISPFTINIPQSELNYLESSLRFSRLGGVTYESETERNQTLGVSHTWVHETREYWLNNFDWRHEEEHINSFPQFTASVQDGSATENYTIHFAALFSKNESAVPLIFLHGWPGSFLEFLPIMSLLRNKYPPEELPYHVIVPSMPGYAFSSHPPLDKELRLEDVARIFDTLMTDLGFGSGYIAQGGDVGSGVARIMGAEHESCKAVHLNLNLMNEPKSYNASSITSAEKDGLARASEFSRTGAAYALLQATRPSTISTVLNSNPLALMTYLGEKFLAWVDKPLPIDTILTDISLYWFTQTIITSLYPYPQVFTPGNISPHDDPKWHLNKPFGLSWFPKEIAPIPRAWAETTGDLVFFRMHDEVSGPRLFEV